MIRPIAALLITILLFAGVYGYTTFVESIRRPPLQVQESFATGEFSVRITRTFDCIGDPDFDVDSLVVRFRGKDLVRRSDKVPQNEIIEIRPLENVTQLDNELYVAASLTLADSDDWDDDVAREAHPDGNQDQPAPTESMLGAMRVQVMKGALTVADDTFWQEPGSTSVEGSVSFETPLELSDRHEHGP